MPAVQASGLLKRFDHTIAVDHVDLTIEDGEVRGLLGPNGAGKTTLLRMLFGLVRPDAGQVELLGRPIRSTEAMQLEGVSGFVEDPSFYPYLTGRANLEVLAELDGSAARERIDDVLATVQLSDRAEDRLSGYSTGMRQRLGIAAALLRGPRLLLLDEPTSGLDPAGVRDVGTLVREVAARGVTVLLSSHQISEIEGICDSFTVLRRGKVAWDGAAADLRAQAPASAYALATSDDATALELAEHELGVEVRRAREGLLTLTVEPRALDPFVLALARHGVAVRRLELLVSPLESMFFALTGEPGAESQSFGELVEQAVATR